MKDNIIYATLRYLYHRFTHKESWRVFWLVPSWNTFGGNEGYWLVSPRLMRDEAKMYTSVIGFWSHIYFDPGPQDYFTKLPEYPNNEILPEASQDVGYYHYKYKATRWGK